MQIDPHLQPSSANLDFAASKGWPREKAIKEFDRFRDHFIASGGKKRDWDATWRNWVTSPYQKRESSNGRPLTPSGNLWPDGIT